MDLGAEPDWVVSGGCGRVNLCVSLFKFLGGVLPDRTIRVFFPGYTPQTSKVVINQGHFLGMGGERLRRKWCMRMAAAMLILQLTT